MMVRWVSLCWMTMMRTGDQHENDVGCDDGGGACPSWRVPRERSVRTLEISSWLLVLAVAVAAAVVVVAIVAIVVAGDDVHVVVVVVAVGNGIGGVERSRLHHWMQLDDDVGGVGVDVEGDVDALMMLMESRWPLMQKVKTSSILLLRWWWWWLLMMRLLLDEHACDVAVAAVDDDDRSCYCGCCGGGRRP